MPLIRPRYRVYLNPTDEHPEGRELEVEVTHGDQLRGELEAGKQGLPPIKDAPMNHTTVWAWCALTRLGEYRAEFRQFKLVDLAGLEPVRDEDDEHVAPPVDPTTADPSGSA